MPAVISPVRFRRAAQEIVPPAMLVWELPSTERAKDLNGRQSFFLSCQHGHKTATWTGRSRDPGVGYLAERLAPQGFISTNSAAAVPYGMRRPDAPHSLHRQIVTRMSDMLLGELARPNLSCPADMATEAYTHAVMDTSASWATLLEARDIKGAIGSAAIFMYVMHGRPMTEALNPAHLWVKEWAEEANWVPKIVVEQKLISKTEVRKEDDKADPGSADWTTVERKARLVDKNYWRTRVWTDTHVIDYKDVPEDWAKDDPVRAIPVDGDPVEHRAGRCPIVWMQNTKNPASPEGLEDYIGTYENSDKLDTMRAFTCRSTIANTDPTLIVKDTPSRLRRNPASTKGHGRKISVDTAGDVKLLESTGDPVRIAMELAKAIRHDILQTSCTVIMDPETLGTYKSAESIRLMMKPMEARAGRLRVPLTDEIEQMCQIWMTLGRNWGVISMEDHHMDARQMAHVEKHPIILPPRVMVDDDDDDDGDKEPELQAHEVGKGQWIDVQWGPYLRPTPTELLGASQALTTANGQQPLLSKETATSIMVGYLGAGSPEEERDRIEAEGETALKEQEKMMFQEHDLDLETERAKVQDAAAETEVKAATKAETVDRTPKPKGTAGRGPTE